MAINIRTKGQNFERKMAKKFNESFGLTCDRNLQQSINGGDDLIGVPFFSIELKKHNTRSIGTWWKQCKASATSQNKMPVLIYEMPRAKPTVVMEVEAVRCVFGNMVDSMPKAPGRLFVGTLVEMSWDQFCVVFRHFVGPGMEA